MIVLELRHRTVNRIARVIGLTHIADRDYYQAINELLRTRSSSKIVSEGIRIPQSVEGDADNMTQALHSDLMCTEADDPITQATNGMIVQQKDLLHIPQKREVLGDLSFTDLIESADEIDSVYDQLLLSYRLQMAALIGSKRRNRDELCRVGMKIPFLRHAVVTYLKYAFHKAMREMVSSKETDAEFPDETFVSVRDAHVCKVIQQVSKTHDVEVPWGAAHVPGITKYLGESGYWQVDPASIRYLTFYSTKRMFPNKKFPTLASVPPENP